MKHFPSVLVLFYFFWTDPGWPFCAALRGTDPWDGCATDGPPKRDLSGSTWDGHDEAYFEARNDGKH